MKESPTCLTHTVTVGKEEPSKPFCGLLLLPVCAQEILSGSLEEGYLRKNIN